MKFMKNNITKKLIMVLVVLILFNAIIPTATYAVDIGGILLQPIIWLWLGVLVPSDLIIGVVVQTSNAISFGSITGWAKEIIGGSASAEASKYLIGPDTIFSGNLTNLNANIFKRVGESGTLGSVANTVAGFYVLLRNIAGVVMLAGLIFTGIKILLSSNIPSTKTKYLTLLQDWLIGMALLIFSHIIMILVFEVSDALVTALSASLNTRR